MSDKTTEQLNKKPEWKHLELPEISTYIEFPIDFTGKSKNGNSSPFAGLLLSYQFILAIIHTFNKISRKPAKLTYEFIAQTFGMSKETISTALSTLEKLNIIEKAGRSQYKIIAKYNKKNRVEIDTYLFKHEWEISGKKKRLSYSRLLILALIKRGNSNPNTDGIFVSSQARIGTALNMPRTTAGDSVREVVAAGLMQFKKQSASDTRKRGCSAFNVHPQLYEVMHPGKNLTALKALFNIKPREPSPEELHAELLRDNVYKDIIDRIETNWLNFLSEARRSRGKDTPELLKLEGEREQLRQELEEYFKRKRIKRSTFPPGFFRTDNTKKA